MKWLVFFTVSLLALVVFALSRRPKQLERPTPEQETAAAVQPIEPAPTPLPPVDPKPEPAPAPTPEPRAAYNRSDDFAAGNVSLLASVLRDSALQLTPEQQEKVVQAFSTYAEVRQQWEADNASVQQSGNGMLRISIPPYQEAGEKMKDLLYQEITDTIGADRLDAFSEAMGAHVEVGFAGFGQAYQELQVEVVDGALRITRIASTTETNAGTTPFIQSTSTDTVPVDGPLPPRWAAFEQHLRPLRRGP